MDKIISDLIYSLPKDGKDYSYANDVSDLDLEDVPKNRISKLKDLMNGKNEYLALEAAKILTCWLDDDGFYFIEKFVCEREPLTENWSPHRLRNYDQTYSFILRTISSYWARSHDKGLGDISRKNIFNIVLKLIYLSNTMPFDISVVFRLVKNEKFTEYLPMIKTHFEAISANPHLHHWKVADCAHFLMEFEPDFVAKTLAKHGKTLADYPNK